MFAGRGRSAFGGEDAGTRADLLKLAPASPPLAPTGGDALMSDWIRIQVYEHQASFGGI